MTGTVRGWSSPGVPSLNETKNFDLEPSDLAWIGNVAGKSAVDENY